MKTRAGLRLLCLGLIVGFASSCRHFSPESEWTELFTEEGVPSGWVVRSWADVAEPAPEGAVWRVQGGVLRGSEPRGTWLVSEEEYDDFILEFEFKLPERGNSGCGIRFPSAGDPAFEGVEIQMVDPRYYGEQQVPPNELTGSIYRVAAPTKQLFRPMEWNKYEIACQGPWVKVALNGKPILEVNMDEEDRPVLRHDGSTAPPLSRRPRSGHIGFQELSRDGGHVQIRNVRIRELD